MKEFLTKNKKAVLTSIATGGALALASAAGAEADTGTVTVMTTTFTSVKDTALAALASIAGVAILLFGGIYAWRYGKKVFAIIAK